MYEVLRTAFHRFEGMAVPGQVVLDHPAVSFREVDAGHAPSQPPEAATVPGVDDPVVHVELARLAPDVHTLLIRVPALCALTQRRFDTSCESSADATQRRPAARWRKTSCSMPTWPRGRTSCRRAKTATPGDWDWQRQRAQRTGSMPLPFQMRSNGRVPFRPDSLRVLVPTPAAMSLAGYAAARSTSLATLLLACWQCLLARLSGQSDVTVHVGARRAQV